MAAGIDCHQESVGKTSKRVICQAVTLLDVFAIHSGHEPVRRIIRQIA
jgi:hypothetical protein